MKKQYIYLTLIILIGIMLIIIYGTKKQVYDGDELYTYTLSNSKIHGFITNNIELNKWTTSEELKNIFELNNDEVFSIFSIYKNQARDVHPPFYYLIFHIASIISLNNFSIVPGLLINIISYIILMIYLYKISEKLTDNFYIPCILYTLSLGMISTAMFIRMYMMLTMMCTIFTYYFLNIKNNEKKDLLKLSICTYFGFMTHYFFLVYAFFISITYLIYQLINKNYKTIKKYIITMIIPIILGFITFPFAYIHIFKGYRGTETQENLIKSNIVDTFKNIYERLNIELFYKIMPIILIIIIILLIYLIKNKKIKEPQFYIITISTLLYFITTLKIIPIQSTRYFYCTYPITILIIYYIISKSINNKYVKAITIVVLITLSLITHIKYNPAWIGKNNYSNNNDKNIIYIIENDYNTIGDSQFLIDYNKIYFTNKDFNDYKIIEKSNEEVVIKTNDIELLENIIKNTKYTKYEIYEIGYILK